MANILVVEDDVGIAEGMDRFLRSLGHTALVVPTAERALETIYSGRRIDLIFSDQQLEGGRLLGTEFLMVLKGDAATAKLPFILTSGDPTPEIDAICQKYRVPFLSKPGYDQLPALLEQELAKK